MKGFFDHTRIIYRHPIAKILKFKLALLIYRLRLHHVLLLFAKKGGGIAKRFDNLAATSNPNRPRQFNKEAQFVLLENRKYDVSQVSHLSEIKAHLFGSWIYDCRHFTTGNAAPVWQGNYYALLLLEQIFDESATFRAVNLGFQSGLLDYYIGSYWKNSTVTGVDIDPYATEWANQHYGNLKPDNVNFVMEDFSDCLTRCKPDVVISSQTICCLTQDQLFTLLDAARTNRIERVVIAEVFCMSDYGNYPKFGAWNRTEPVDGGAFYLHDYITYFQRFGYKTDFADWFPNHFPYRVDHHLFIGSFSLVK
jgi:hypothetical protein